MQYSVDLNRRIPKPVFYGKYPLYESVAKVFKNVLLQTYLQQVYDSYLTRSQLSGEPNMKEDWESDPTMGEADDDNNQWIQLAPKTYRTKTKAHKEGKLQKYLQERLADYGNNPAAKHVLERIVKTGGYEQDRINIRTGELLASFFPPHIEGDEIRPHHHQNVSVTLTSLEFSTTLGDKEETCAKFGREIIPEGMERDWIERAIPPALDAAEIEYDRLLMRYRHKPGGSKTKAPRTTAYQLPLFPRVP